MATKQGDPETRDKIVPVRMSSEEKAYLEGAARRLGANLSTWLRMLGIERAETLVGPMDGKKKGGGR